MRNFDALKVELKCLKFRKMQRRLLIFPGEKYEKKNFLSQSRITQMALP